MSDFVAIAKISDVSESKPFHAVIGRREVVVFQKGQEYFIMDRQCPHKGGPMEQGVLGDGNVYCPLHGWGFDLKTGKCDLNKEKTLRMYPVRVVNGEIQALL